MNMEVLFWKMDIVKIFAFDSIILKYKFLLFLFLSLNISNVFDDVLYRLKIQIEYNKVIIVDFLFLMNHNNNTN